MLKIKIYKPSKETGHNVRESVESDLQMVHILELSDVKYKIIIFNMFNESLKMRKRANKHFVEE